MEQIQMVSYSDVEEFLIQLRSEIEQTIQETPLKNQSTIQKLETRSQNILSAINMIQSEIQYYERGICCICGVIGDSKYNNKIYCGFHGLETENQIFLTTLSIKCNEDLK